MLVREIERWIASEADPRSLEYSAILSAALATIGRRSEAFDGDSSDDAFFFEEAWSRWKALSQRRFGRSVSPIVVEISVDVRSADVPLHIDSHGLRFWENYRLVFRQSKRARLQQAEAGGRFVPSGPYKSDIFESQPGRMPDPPPTWGTLGGFLQAIDGSLYGVTAAHVAHREGGYATPAFSGAAIFGLQSRFQQFSLRLPLAQWRSQFGLVCRADPPKIVGRWQCSSTSLQATDGLDVALIHFPGVSADWMQCIDVVGTGQVSQSLRATFVGATSGLTRARVSTLSIWYSYEMPNDWGSACVADCFQIALSPRPYFRTDVSRNGDSGAWLITKTTEGIGWVGVLLGGDGDRSGVVPAQRIIDHFTTLLGPLTPMI